MKNILLTTILIVASFATQANATKSEPSFCEWLGDAATAIAQNRDNGIDEYDLVGKFLSENRSYGEQSVVIPLIDRVYGVESNMSPEEIAFVEKELCEINLATSGVTLYIQSN